MTELGGFRSVLAVCTHPDDEIDVVLKVDRDAQRRAAELHRSQSAANPTVWPRMELHGDTDTFRWLRR